jgi:1-acyl-sn-glycerol-3-phosphate acyltransferase
VVSAAAALTPAPGVRVRLRITWRLMRLALLLARGVFTIVLLFPFANTGARRRMKQRWSRDMLGIFAIRLDPIGVPLEPGSMVVANHISWLDIYAVNALHPVAFVSKAEVRDWPLIGWLARHTETIFLRRGSRGHARLINDEIAAALGAGGNVAVFPEGTTTDGTHLLHFHAALLQPAIASGHPLQPVAIDYRDPTGAERSTVAEYAGETTMLQSLVRVAAADGLMVRLWVGASITDGAGHRRELAAAARAAIAEQLGLKL